MSQVKTIFKNMSWLMISQIIASICGFIWTILIARYLGVNEYGILGFAISFTGILNIITDLGVSTHIVRHVATDNDSAPKYMGNAIPLKGLFSIGTLAITLIILILMKSDKLTIIITLLFTFEMIFKSFISLLNGGFLAFEKGKYQGIENSLLNTLLLIFILISIYADLGIYGITISYVLSNLIALVYAYYAFRTNITKPKFELDRSFCKTITLLAIPFALTSFLSTVYFSIDVVMLTNIVGNYATGIYNASYKLISILTLFYSIYLAVVFPLMSKLFKNDKQLLIISFEKSLKYLTMIIIPIALGTTFYSLDVIHLIYGHEYDAGFSVLQILIWTVPFLFISGACNTLLYSSHKEKSVTKIYIIAAIFNIVLNLIMIPSLSYNGAAITTVLSEILIVAIQFYIIYKINHKISKKLYYDLFKIILASSIVGVMLYILNLNMWLAIPFVIIIYLLSLTLLKFFDDDDKYIIKEILGKTNKT